MINRIFQCFIILSLITLAGCYPQGPESTEDFNLVYTNYSNEFDFASKSTFALPDSVIKITGDNFEDNDGNGKPQFVASDYSVPILSEIKAHMEAYGWTQVPKNAEPDVILLVSSMSTTNLYYYYDWWYWGWWYPGWYPYWGWYYPGGYYPTYITGYRSGSVFIQMVDRAQAPVSDNVPVVWNAIINGLAEGGTAAITQRIVTTMNQVFTQSPYLNH